MTQPRTRTRRYSIPIGIAVGAIALLLAACGTGPIPGQPSSQATAASSGSSSGSCTAATAQSAVTVDAGDDLKFSPASVCLKVGGTITWKNTGDISHSITDDAADAAVASDALLPPGAKSWNHDPLAGGASWSLKFTVAGKYKYFCIPHETLGMLGSITVVS
jgi:plastocyanin